MSESRVNNASGLCPVCRTLPVPFSGALVCDLCLDAAQIARTALARSQEPAGTTMMDEVDPRFESPPTGIDRYKKGGPHSSSPYKRGGP